MFKLFRLVFLALFFSMGFAVFLYSLWSFNLARQSLAWPVAMGRILKDECRVAVDRASDRLTLYQYTVSATEYTSEREYFGIRFAIPDCSAGYVTGSMAAVHYNPADPAQAVLKPGYYRSAAFGLFAGLAFMAFAAVAHRLESRRRKSSVALTESL